MTGRLTPDEARERLEHFVTLAVRDHRVDDTRVEACLESCVLDSILATTDALAVLADPAELLGRWIEDGRIQATGWDCPVVQVDTDDDGTVILFPELDADASRTVEHHLAVNYDRLAVRVTWPALLAAGERAGKLEAAHPVWYASEWDADRVAYLPRLTDPEAAS